MEETSFRSQLKERCTNALDTDGIAPALPSDIRAISRHFKELPAIYRIFLEECGESGRDNFSMVSLNASKVIARNARLSEVGADDKFRPSDAKVIGQTTAGYSLFFWEKDLKSSDPHLWTLIDDGPTRELIDNGPFSTFVIRLMDIATGREEPF